MTQDPSAMEALLGGTEERALYEAFERGLLGRVPDVTMRLDKTQLTLRTGLVMGAVSHLPARRAAERPRHYITVSLGLPYALGDPRVVAVRVRDNRYTHHVLVGRVDELDEEFWGWVEEAAAFARR